MQNMSTPPPRPASAFPVLTNGTDGKDGVSIADSPTAAAAHGIARGHHAPAFGVACQALGVPQEQAVRAYLFMVARDVLSAATRQVRAMPILAPQFAGYHIPGMRFWTLSREVVFGGGGREGRGGGGG